MSNKPPIGCFNGSECIYNPELCRLYEDRTEECRLENLKNWLKETAPQKYQAGTPVETVKPAEVIQVPPKVSTPTTPTAPFDYATMKTILDIRTHSPRLSEESIIKMVREEMAKAAGLLTSEGAAYLVKTKYETDNTPEEKPKPKVGTITGRVLDDPVSREVNTQRGPKAVSSFSLDSGEEQVRVSLWERQDIAQLISAGNEITLEGVVEGTVFDGLKQFNGGTRTVLVGANVAGIAVPQEKKVFVIKNPNAPATEAQINQLNKMGVKSISPNITKQQASDLISSRMKK